MKTICGQTRLAVVASSAIFFSLALASCSQAPNVEDQTKLIQYEKCLELEIKKTERVQKLFDDYLIDVEEWSERTSFSYVESLCEKYRP